MKSINFMKCLKILGTCLIISLIAVSCNLGGVDTTDGADGSETYDVKFEVTGTEKVVGNTAGIAYSVSGDQSTSYNEVPWEKVVECGGDESLELVATSEQRGTITVAIYINGVEEVKRTGEYNDGNNETGALVEASTP